ncbi:ABC transporter permease subunit [Roseinatronobacter monicus]|uniref:ABC-type dipeptide/oligopeptide/nickel transport system permease subunit n=1 Tax=Roseinatronobacter monicus TaxID=393481 RepID=A0A543KGX5_9RHOB|nr:ABC transporter permease subunit [Roseinatronobacter monicus]TQM94331.1 ABC-type dipeptide/oligopeptide/nickel transport system permease subunit [Roseinatronobacter monicus]
MTLPPILRAAMGPLRLMMQDRLAVIGMCVLGVIVAMALFAPVLSPHDPRHINEIEDGSVLARGADAWELRESLGPLALNDAAQRGDQSIIVGRSGTVWTRADTGDWTRIDVATEADLNAVDLNADGRAVVAGTQGTILLGTGADWQLVPAPEADLRGVKWLDTERALIVGANEEIWLLDAAAGTFSEIDSPVGRGFPLNAVALDADGTAMIVGERGLAIRYDPETGAAELERIGSSRDLNHIHIAPDGAALVVGERGTLLRRDSADGDWVTDPAPDTRALRAGWIGDDGRAVAAGRNGIIMEWDGAAWQIVPTESERHLRALLMVGDDWLALGSDRFVTRLSPPSREHWFGTDHLGRDLFSQNVHGSQIALLVGFLGATLVVLIGTNVGLIAGYYRGRTETILMRTVDVMYGIPFEPFALILVLLFQPSLTIVILAVSLLTWRTVARLIRSQVLSLRERPFVKAARVAGASDLRIMYLHIFPNVLPLVFLELAIIVGVSIIAEATLSFLGLGPPQSISWGGILHDARLSGAWRTAWWWNLPPGILIMTTVLSVFFISRSLEVVANPRLRARQ